MQFQYLIINLTTGEATGSNDKQIGESFVQNDDFLVINVQDNTLFDQMGHSQEIKEETNPVQAREAGFDPNAQAEDPDTGGGNDTGTGR